MILASGDYGAWEIDPDNSRLRWLGLHGPLDEMPHKLRSLLGDDGMPLCEAERTGEDGWATYHRIITCEVGAPFVVRWPDGKTMFVPTRLTTVEDA